MVGRDPMCSALLSKATNGYL